jgi:hypothetical protein
LLRKCGRGENRESGGDNECAKDIEHGMSRLLAVYPSGDALLWTIIPA